MREKCSVKCLQKVEVLGKLISFSEENRALERDGRLNFVIAELIGDIRVLGAPLGLAAAVVERRAALGGATMGRVRVARRQAARNSLLVRQHAVLCLRRRPVHRLKRERWIELAGASLKL